MNKQNNSLIQTRKLFNSVKILFIQSVNIDTSNCTRNPKIRSQIYIDGYIKYINKLIN